MGKFRKNGKKGIVPLSTASLPDIVFMLLFFFMVATVLRTEEPKVRIDRPELNEIYTLKKKHLIRYVSRHADGFYGRWNGNENSIE